jgi:hypothetical protein
MRRHRKRAVSLLDRWGTVSLRSYLLAALFLACPVVGQTLGVAPSDWTRFRSIEGGFSISMPGTPEPMSQETPSHLVLKLFAVRTTIESYVASYTDVADGSRNKEVLTGVWKSLANQSKLLSESVITVSGHPAAMATGVKPDGTSFSAAYLMVGRRLYTVMYQCVGSQTADHRANGTKFINSFRIEKQ